MPQRRTKTRAKKRGKKRVLRTRRKHMQRVFRGGDVKFDVIFREPDGRKIFVNGQHLTKEQTRIEPDVEFVYADWTAYVVVMYDNDAPSPSRIHWMYAVVDHRSDSMYSMVTYHTADFFKYQPPNPPQGEIHTYTIELLSKPYDGRGVLGIIPEVPHARTDFDIEEFKRVNQLSLDARKTFTCGAISRGIGLPIEDSLSMRETPIQPSRAPISGARMLPIRMLNLSSIM